MNILFLTTLVSALYASGIDPYDNITTPVLAVQNASRPSSSPPRIGRMVAFGDWGENDPDSLARINEYIRNPDRRIHSVFLLGDNFYPRGIPKSPRGQNKFKLFTHHLARNVTDYPLFIPVLGNHDYLGNVSAQLLFDHPNWYMPKRNHFMRFRNMKNDTHPYGLPGCVWFIDSIHFEIRDFLQLSQSLEKNSRNCQWKIFVSHYPIVTAGIYFDSVEVAKFRGQILPLIAKYKIDLVISGHDHNSQVIKIPSVPETLFVIAGAPVLVDWRSIDPHSRLPLGGKLVWFNDVKSKVILELEMTQSKLDYTFVQLLDHGEKMDLFKGRKFSPQALARLNARRAV